MSSQQKNLVYALGQEVPKLVNRHVSQWPIYCLFFQGLPNLEKLDLSQTAIDNNDSPNGCFSGVGSTLRYLLLSNNHLTIVKSSYFTGLDHLESLKMISNDITTIQSGKLTA